MNLGDPLAGLSQTERMRLLEGDTVTIDVHLETGPTIRHPDIPLAMLRHFCSQVRNGQVPVVNSTINVPSYIKLYLTQVLLWMRNWCHGIPGQPGFRRDYYGCREDYAAITFFGVTYLEAAAFERMKVYITTGTMEEDDIAFITRNFMPDHKLCKFLIEHLESLRSEGMLSCEESEYICTASGLRAAMDMVTWQRRLDGAFTEEEAREARAELQRATEKRDRANEHFLHNRPMLQYGRAYVVRAPVVRYVRPWGFAGSGSWL